MRWAYNVVRLCCKNAMQFLSNITPGGNERKDELHPSHSRQFSTWQLEKKSNGNMAICTSHLTVNRCYYRVRSISFAVTTPRCLSGWAPDKRLSNDHTRPLMVTPCTSGQPQVTCSTSRALGAAQVSTWSDVKAIRTYRGRPWEANQWHPFIGDTPLVCVVTVWYLLKYIV